MTRVIKVDNEGKPMILLTPVNSKIHKEAKKNAARFRKERRQSHHMDRNLSDKS